MLLCEVSTKFGLYSLITLLEQDDRLPPAADRVLLVSTHTNDPEAQDPLLAFAQASPQVAAAFSRVISLNAIISPLHPTQWQAPVEEISIQSMQSILRAAFGLAPGERLDLMMESIQTPPSNTLARIMQSSDIYLYSDGLMTYGPTRFQLPYSVASRIRRLYYMDLIPGLQPSLLREFGIESQPIAPAGLRNTLESLSKFTKDTLNAEGLDGAPVFLGQYLSGLNLCTPEEEVELYAQALNICSLLAQGDSKTVFFKPHPTFSAGLVHALKTSPKLRGFDLRILDTGPLMEEFLLHYEPAFIASVFSTGLATAREMFGIDAYAYDTQSFLQRLRPYENSNRIPAALIHYAFPAIPNPQVDMPLATLQTKIDILAAGMQPALLANTVEEQARLLGQPKDSGDLIEEHARERIAQHAPRTAPSFLRLAIQGRSAEEGALYETDDDRVPAPPEAKERPLEKAQRLLETGRAAEAFTISAKALRETPTSSRHMKILETASAELGGLYQHQYNRIQLIHEAAVAKQKGPPSSEATDPLQAATDGQTGTSAPETSSPKKKVTGAQDSNRPSFWRKIRR